MSNENKDWLNDRDYEDGSYDTAKSIYYWIKMQLPDIHERNLILDYIYNFYMKEYEEIFND